MILTKLQNGNPGVSRCQYRLWFYPFLPRLEPVTSIVYKFNESRRWSCHKILYLSKTKCGGWWRLAGDAYFWGRYIRGEPILRGKSCGECCTRWLSMSTRRPEKSVEAEHPRDVINLWLLSVSIFFWESKPYLNLKVRMCLQPLKLLL